MAAADARAALLAELSQALELFQQLESHLHDPDLCRALAPRLASHIQNSIRIASPRPPLSSRFQGPRGETPPKRRTAMNSWTRRVRLSSVAGGVEGTGHDDGFTWRKYGQKEILGAKYPRAYFRCTHSASHGCPAKKQVQRSDDDLLVFDITYHEHHTCLRQRRDRHAMYDHGQEQSMAERFEAEEFVPQIVPSLGSSMDEIESFGLLDDYWFSTSPLPTSPLPDWEL